MIPWLPLDGGFRVRNPKCRVAATVGTDRFTNSQGDTDYLQSGRLCGIEEVDGFSPCHLSHGCYSRCRPRPSKPFGFPHRGREHYPNRRDWCRANFAIPDFEFVNDHAYFDYQRDRVFIRTNEALRKSKRREQRTKGEKNTRVDRSRNQHFTVSIPQTRTWLAYPMGDCRDWRSIFVSHEVVSDATLPASPRLGTTAARARSGSFRATTCSWRSSSTV